MSAAAVLNGICTYLGGAYDATTHTYRSSTIPGVGTVRRAWAKRDDQNDYYRGAPTGTRSGAQIVVFIPDQDEYRETLGGAANGGKKRVIYSVQLNVFVWSECEYAEDAQDDVHALRDALVDVLRADPTLGGAVFESGEAVQGAASRGFAVRYGQPVSKAEITKSFFTIAFDCVEFVNG